MPSATINTFTLFVLLSREMRPLRSSVGQKRQIKADAFPIEAAIQVHNLSFSLHSYEGERDKAKKKWDRQSFSCSGRVVKCEYIVFYYIGSIWLPPPVWITPRLHICLVLSLPVWLPGFYSVQITSKLHLKETWSCSLISFLLLSLLASIGKCGNEGVHLEAPLKKDNRWWMFNTRVTSVPVW